MNYRHAYHAGNFADVHKHAVLTLILAHLLRKETPFHVLDCHAGIGRYDLSGIEAGKTGEFEGGIGKILRAMPDDPLLADYLARVRQEKGCYPGSPWLIRAAMRPIDRLTLVELHPEDAQSLRGLFHRDRQTAIREEDAYRAAKAVLPPKERRGLVLIDPPYEEKDEMNRLVRGLGEALRRWATGIYAIWYPIKSSTDADRLEAEIANFGKPCLASRLMLHDAGDETRLNGSGLALINPPWQLDTQLESLMPLLHRLLDARGRTGLRWLVNG